MNLSELANSFEVQVDFVRKSLAEGEMLLSHPDLGVSTSAFQSFKAKQLNVVAFCGKKPEESWFLVQATHCFVIGYFDSKLRGTLFNAKAAKRFEQARSVIASLIPHIQPSHSRFDGLELSNIKPYHFWFDQIAPIFSFGIKELKGKLYANRNRYIDTIGDLELLPRSELGCYVIAPQDSHPIRRSAPDQNELKMIDALRNEISFERSNPLQSFNLWFGITGQKRCWLEQQQGFRVISEFLSERFANVTIFLDGVTAFSDGCLAEDDRSAIEDSYVLKNLLDYGYPSNVKVVSLIGMPTKEKLKYAELSDYFIANAGGGCLIPLVFCRRPGLVHSLEGAETFKRYYTRDTSVLLSRDFTKGGKKKWLRDYHIDPLSVLDQLKAFLV